MISSPTIASDRLPTSAEIFGAVGVVFNCGVEDLMGEVRPRRRRLARMLVRVLLRRWLDLSYPRIQRVCALRSHSPVVQDCIRFAKIVRSGGEDAEKMASHLDLVRACMPEEVLHRCPVFWRPVGGDTPGLRPDPVVEVRRPQTRVVSASDLLVRTAYLDGAYARQRGHPDHAVDVGRAARAAWRRGYEAARKMERPH